MLVGVERVRAEWFPGAVIAGSPGSGSRGSELSVIGVVVRPSLFG